jgi:hypothetical protein
MQADAGPVQGVRVLRFFAETAGHKRLARFPQGRGCAKVGSRITSSCSCNGPAFAPNPTRNAMSSELKTATDGSVESNEGWALRFLEPNILEYCGDGKVCLVNVESPKPPITRRKIHATESTSDLFPHLHEHLVHASRFLKGAFEIV